MSYTLWYIKLTKFNHGLGIIYVLIARFQMEQNVASRFWPSSVGETQDCSIGPFSVMAQHNGVRLERALGPVMALLKVFSYLPSLKHLDTRVDFFIF